MGPLAFGFEPYHILLVVLGAGLLLSFWLPQLVFRRLPSASAGLIAFGLLGAILFPGIFAGIDPTINPALWEVAAEIVVIVVLFSTGLRIYEIRGSGAGALQPAFSR